jgi:hypothetical protein
MTCREFRGLLVYIAFGDLPPEQLRSAKGHLKQCLTCAAEWRDYQNITQLARQLAPAPLPPELEGRLQSLLKSLRRDEAVGGS